jgi:DNA-binding transcriptional MerR regulator
MFSAATYSRAQMATLTGLSDDVLAHWIKEGLLKPEVSAGGTGRHKAFGPGEVNKAAILGQLRSFNCSISTLRWFAALLDRAQELSARYQEIDPYKFYLIKYSVQLLREFLDGGPALLWVHGEGDAPVERRAKSIREILDVNERELSESELAVYHQIVQNHVYNDYDLLALDVASDLAPTSISHPSVGQIWLTWPVDDGWKIYSDSDENLSGLRDWPHAAILLNISRIIKSVWGLEIRPDCNEANSDD